LKITLLVIGKTNEKYLEEGIKIYLKRLPHYCAIEYKELKDVKSFSNSEDLKNKEGEIFLSHISKDDFVILLDENGKEYTSRGLSEYIEKHTINSTKNLILAIGGAFGFSESMYKRANHKIALSKMTYSHQMIRLFLVEQLYRAFTILKGEKYHND
jgi:23S rRNA (pseudouridine1915-N3)-methyltransferase